MTLQYTVLLSVGSCILNYPRNQFHFLTTENASILQPCFDLVNDRLATCIIISCLKHAKLDIQ